MLTQAEYEAIAAAARLLGGPHMASFEECHPFEKDDVLYGMYALAEVSADNDPDLEGNGDAAVNQAAAERVAQALAVLNFGVAYAVEMTASAARKKSFIAAVTAGSVELPDGRRALTYAQVKAMADVITPEPKED